MAKKKRGKSKITNSRLQSAAYFFNLLGTVEGIMKRIFLILVCAGTVQAAQKLKVDADQPSAGQGPKSPAVRFHVDRPGEQEAWQAQQVDEKRAAAQLQEQLQTASQDDLAEMRSDALNSARYLRMARTQKLDGAHMPEAIAASLWQLEMLHKVQLVFQRRRTMVRRLSAQDSELLRQFEQAQQPQEDSRAKAAALLEILDRRRANRAARNRAGSNPAPSEPKISGKELNPDA